MKYYTSAQLMKMDLNELQNLTFDQLMEGICALEVTMYVLESNGYDYFKEASKQRDLKGLLRRAGRSK